MIRFVYQAFYYSIIIASYTFRKKEYVKFVQALKI